MTNNPRPPAYMTAEAKAEWRRLAPLLIARGMFDAGTASALETLCGHLAVMRMCDATIAKEGYMVKGKDCSRPHPAIGARNRAGMQALQLQRRLGLIADAETAAPPAPGDAYSELGID